MLSTGYVNTYPKVLNSKQTLLIQKNINSRSLYETHTYFLCPFFFLANKRKDSYYYFFSNSSKAQNQPVTCQIPHFCYNTDCFNTLYVSEGALFPIPPTPLSMDSSSVSICCHKKWYCRSWAGTHGAIATC